MPVYQKTVLVLQAVMMIVVVEQQQCGSLKVGFCCLTQVLPCSPARGVSYTLHPHPWRAVVCGWSVVVLNNSAPSLAVTGWLQDQCCDAFYD